MSIVSIKTEGLGNWNIARIDGKRMELQQQLRLQRPDGCCIREGKRWEQRDDMMEVCDWIIKHSRHDRQQPKEQPLYTVSTEGEAILCPLDPTDQVLYLTP